MSKKTSEEQKEKKKRGFLWYLWLLFFIFIILLSMATGFFYWQTDMVTGWALELYAKRLAHVMTSQEYYQMTQEDEKNAETFLQKKRDTILPCFIAFVEAYKNFPKKEGQECQEIFKQLHKQIVEIFQDNKVVAAELDNFVKEVQKATESFK